MNKEKFKEFVRNNSRWIIGFGIIVIVTAILFRIFGIGKADLFSLLATVLHPYLLVAEKIAMIFIRLFTEQVTIQDHQVVFSAYELYYNEYAEIIDNWTSYLLFLKWTAFNLFMIWLFSATLKRKFQYTFYLLLVHLFSVVSGLVLIAGIGPVFVNVDSLTQLQPHFMGALAMFGFFVLWQRKNWTNVQDKLNRIGIRFVLERSKKREIIYVVFFFVLLKNFLVPYINYYDYVHFLLLATKFVVNIFGYSPEISGAYLIGGYGTLFMAKWCLGFVTMFVFASMVYLTRSNNKTAWLYIMAGIIFLHIVNIIRLAVLYMYVQHHDDSEMIMDHHDIYNIVVYIIIFFMWVLWYEKFLKIKRT